MSRKSLKRRLLRRPSPAMVVAMIALGAAMAGVANGGIGSKSAPTAAAGPFITGAHVLDGSLTGADINQATLTAVANAAHANGADFATNAGHATSADSAGNANTLGGVAPNRYLLPGYTLASGDTETGAYGTAASTGEWGVAAITFVPKLAAAPTATEYVSGAGTATCPGRGQATPGRLCIYQGWISTMTLSCIGSPAAACGTGPTVDGAEVYFSSSATTGNTTGTWAYKAP